MVPFERAAFLKSAAALEDLPESDGEIAFVGRSNAGKSSALNTLIGRKVAFVSKTPGRTQLLNFYELLPRKYLVDLPGYGFAKVPSAIRAPWEALLGAYLQHREPLRGLALIMDIRHALTELDWRMLEWFRPTGKPVHVLLTKADKLSRAATQEILRDTRTTLAARSSSITVQCFSSLRKFGVREAADTLGSWLGPANEIDDR